MADSLCCMYLIDRFSRFLIVPRKGIREIFACGIRNPGKFCLWNLESWALESRIKLKESGMQGSTKKAGIKCLESGIHSMESIIQDCLGFPYMR